MLNFDNIKLHENLFVKMNSYVYMIFDPYLNKFSYKLVI